MRLALFSPTELVTYGLATMLIAGFLAGYVMGQYSTRREPPCDCGYHEGDDTPHETWCRTRRGK